MSADAISGMLRDFCRDLTVTERPDGRFRIDTPFVFGDGDGFPILLEKGEDGWRFTDRGGSAGHLFFDEPDMTPGQYRFVERIAHWGGLGLSEEYEMTSREFEGIPTATDLADFIQAVARVGAVVGYEKQSSERYLSRVRARVTNWVEDPAEKNWHYQADQERGYVADLRITPRASDRRLVMFFVGSGVKAHTSTISLQQYRNWGLANTTPLVACKPTVPSIDRHRLNNALFNHGQVVDVPLNSTGFTALRDVLEREHVALTPA